MMMIQKSDRDVRTLIAGARFEKLYESFCRKSIPSDEVSR